MRDMFDRAFQRIERMAEETNGKNGIFKLQFTLGHMIELGVLLSVLIPLWVGQVGADATSRASLDQIKSHLDKIDETARVALIDDDRLQRVTEDIKEIRAELSDIKKNIH
jgi:hypothetical protein